MRRPSTSRDRDSFLEPDDDNKSEPAKRACVACRTVKVRPASSLHVNRADSLSLQMRCLPQEPSGLKCARCERLQQECVWAAPQKRGRKPKGHRCVLLSLSSRTRADPAP